MTNRLPVSQITDVQVNMIAQDNIPTLSGEPGKNFCALGDGPAGDFNEPITFSTASSATYSNVELKGTPGYTPGAVFYTAVGISPPEPSTLPQSNYQALEITNWSVQLTE